MCILHGIGMSINAAVPRHSQAGPQRWQCICVAQPLLRLHITGIGVYAAMHQCPLLQNARAGRVAMVVLVARSQSACCLQVKPFFDDAAHDKNSCHMVNHVTVSQFKQGLGVKMGFTSLSQSDISVLIEKFLDDEYPPGDMINYVAFAHCLNPPTPDYD